jgi:SAM-dependent methyltransferase
MNVRLLVPPLLDNARVTVGPEQLHRRTSRSSTVIVCAVIIALLPIALQKFLSWREVVPYALLLFDDKHRAVRCVSKVPWRERTRLSRSAMDSIYFTRYAPYYALVDWLLDNPDEARGQVLEISGKSWLQQFFVQSHTTFTNSAINEIEVDIIHLDQTFRGSLFDWVILDQVLEHVSNPFAAILQIRRVLRPGGRVLVTVPAQNPWHAGPRDYWRFSARLNDASSGSFCQH